MNTDTDPDNVTFRKLDVDSMYLGYWPVTETFELGIVGPNDDISTIKIPESTAIDLAMVHDRRAEDWNNE